MKEREICDLEPITPSQFWWGVPSVSCRVLARVANVLVKSCILRVTISPPSKAVLTFNRAKILSDEDKLQKFLQKNESTKYIRLQWIDFSGILRTRFVPVTRCLQIARGNEAYHLQQVCMIVPVSTAPRCFPTGNEIEIWALRPDWSSLRVCGFRASHASVMCFVEHKEVEETYNKCPRMLLSGALEELHRLWGAKVTVGFEIEFMLLDQNFQPLNQLDRLNSYQTTNGLRGQMLDIVEEILADLEDSSINIYHFHTETRDQIEFALSPES